MQPPCRSSGRVSIFVGGNSYAVGRLWVEVSRRTTGDGMTQPTPGWYPDPGDPSRQRYFDGRVWTDNYAPYVMPPGQTAPNSPIPPKRKSNWPLIAIGATLLVVFVAFGSCGIDDEKKSTKSTSTARSSAAMPTKTTTRTPTKPTGPVVAPAGSAVRDGKFEFQVLGVQRSATKPGIFTPEQAKGEFFTVKLRVTNIGDQARTFWASNQKLITNGNTYEASSSLGDDSFREEINPGLSIEASVAFDIPPGAAPEMIVCHDSAFSLGARLAL